jgi:NAD(P)-dependent dehydrogenase (short-subunit alcohol dehydrogenase family)
MRLKGKRAFITGGASGLGLAMANRFVEEGAKVVIADINGKEAAEVAAKGGFGYVTGDVSKLSDAKRMVDEALAQLGGMEILVNNAGIETTGSVTSCDDDEWERQIGINLNGTYRISRFAIPAMIASGGGSVINISSVGGLVAVKEYSAYGASKAAILQLTKSMCADYAEHNIRVNCLCPGPIDTPLLQRACEKLGGEHPEAIRNLYASFTIMKRLGLPQEVANAALFLASDEASYITGVALPVDGGFVAQ